MRTAPFVTTDDRGIDSDLVLEFLQNHTTPEHIGVLTRGVVILKDLGLEDVESPLEDYVMRQSDEIDSQDLFVMIVEEIQGLLMGVVIENRITLNSEVNIYGLVNAVECIYQLGVTEQSEDIINILDMQEDRSYTLARLFGLVGSIKTDNVLDDIWDVAPEFLEHLRAVHQQQLADVKRVNGFQNLQRYKQDLLRYHVFLKTENTRVMRLLKNGLEIGLPLVLYLNRFEQEFTTLKDTNIAVEFFGFHLLSQERDSDVLKLADQYLKLVVSDVSRLQAIRMTIRNISINYLGYSKENPITP